MEDVIGVLCFLLISVSFIQDLSHAHKNSIQLTCLTRRFSLLYLVFHFSGWKHGGELYAVAAVVFVHTLNLPQGVPLTFALVLAPFLVLSVLFQQEILPPNIFISLLLPLHGIVVPAFWIGVLFLDRHSDASILIQSLLENPTRLLCGLQYFSILIDHGGYNVLICMHIVSYYNSRLSFGLILRTWYFRFLTLYGALLLGCGIGRYSWGKQLRKTLIQQGYHILGQPANILFPQCCDCMTNELKPNEQSSEGVKVIEAARAELLRFYHRPKCPSEFDLGRVEELLSRTLSRERVNEVLQVFVNPLSSRLLTSTEVKSWVEAYEYLSLHLPYDVLFPHWNKCSVWEAWGDACVIGIWIGILGMVWIELLYYFYGR